MKNTYPLCFWKLRGVEPEVHIFGSVHNVAADTFPLPDHIEATIDRAETIMFEGGRCPRSDSVIERNTNCDPIELRLARRPNLIARMKAAALRHRIDLAEIDRDALWLAGLAISGASLENSGKPMSEGVDNYVRRRSSDDADFEFLESGDQMVAGLTEMSLQAQLYFFEKRLEQAEGELLPGACELERAWRHGNIEYFARENAEEARMHPEQHRILLTDRNLIWLTNIYHVLKRKRRTLIVGGTCHFVGVGSVLQLLKREQGIRADQIRIK